MTNCNQSFVTCFPGLAEQQPNQIHPTEFPPVPNGEIFTGEKFDNRSLVWSERNTVSNLRLNSLYVTKITHNIGILDSANEIYCANPIHGIYSHSTKSIKVYFSKCGKCRLCLDLQRFSDNMSIPRIAMLGHKNVN